MLDFKINKKECTQCGLCVKECPVSIIELRDFPQIKDGKEKNCIKCQHCLAVCPTGALSILRKEPQNSMSIKGDFPKPEELTRLIKTRRSIRKYKDEDVDKTLIHEILDTALHAPTGHNSNSVLFSVIDNKADLAKFREIAYNAIKKHALEGTIPDKYKYLSKIQQVWEKKGIDIIFRNAPHMLIATCSSTVSSPVEDSIIALSYFELLANSNDIGTLWNGMINWTINNIATELKECLALPEDHIFGYSLIFGIPATKYARGIQLEGNHINTISL